MVSIAAAVLTRNVFDYGRRELLEDCVRSLAAADIDVVVVDNHSTDGTQDLVRDWDGYCSTDRLTTCGHGTNLCARIATGRGADLCVLSDDDMLWRDGWADKLRAWWADAPDEVMLTGCHVEPVFTWNKIRGRAVYGGIPGLLRDSTGAASWSFRSTDWRKIGPVPERQQGWGDVPTCQRVRARGYEIAQLDLCVHRGVDSSTWGNRTVEMHGWNVEPALDILHGHVEAPVA